MAVDTYFSYLRMSMVQKKKSLLMFALLILFVQCVGCMSESQISFHRYKGLGDRAERTGDWTGAYDAYLHAAESAKVGYLGPAYESDALYNLGRMNRLLGKLDESEDVLKRCLEIDEKLRGADGLQVGYTLVELAATYLAAKKHEEGVLLLERLQPMIGQYNVKGQMRAFIKRMYVEYAKELSARGMVQKTLQFEKVARSLD